ncbi:MAG: hypothetical protein E7057_07405 [Lentisphaerae bacterium]|nr:hypothetical protein [Lentisphaerota bacterium]
MSLKQLSSNKKGQLILCCVILGAVWGFLLIRFGASYFKDLPDQKRINNAGKELEKAKADFEKYDAENRKNQQIRRQYRQLAAKAWITSIDGAVETALRRRISEVSEKLDFRLNSIGSANVVRINNDFSHADITLQGAGEIGDVIRFLAALAKIEPQLSWRQLQLTPDNRFNRFNRSDSSVQSVNLATQLNTIPATRLNFRGTLRVLVYIGSMTPAELKITRLPVPDTVNSMEAPEDSEFAPPAGEAGVPADPSGKAEETPASAEVKK